LSDSPKRTFSKLPPEIAKIWNAPDKDKLAKLNQLNLFETSKEGKFEVVQKLPYKFKFHFKDNQGTESRMMIEDWETGQLYWNCLARHDGTNRKQLRTFVKNTLPILPKPKTFIFS